MKQVFLVAAVALACAAMASGQTGVEALSTSDEFEIGTKKVRIPAPDGFIKIGPVHGRMLSIQQAAEPAQNEIFAIHLPADALYKYGSEFDRQPDFFTKVSVSRIGRNEDITPAAFEGLGRYIESEFSRMTDPNGKKAIEGQQFVSKNLSDLLRTATKVKWSRPINLGVFDKGPGVHSTLALVSLSANGKPYIFLGTVSFMRVNDRILYLYAYKSNPMEEDLEMLREFTRRWTASIVAANDELIAKGR